jgi:K+-sensing histidine kinase KdpD
MRTTLEHSRLGLAAAITGPLISVGVAWATSSVGADSDERLTLANVALLLAGITAAAALIDWLAGLTTSLAAALSLNWFHTEPVQTFRITSRDDVTAVLLLAALGVGVSTVTALRVRAANRAGRAIGAARARHDIEPLMTEPLAVEDLWHASVTALSSDLGLVRARLVPGVPAATLPAISRQEWTDDSGLAALVLPPAGAAVPLRGGQRQWLLLEPNAGAGAVTVDRRAVAAFVDALTLALLR